MGKLFIRFAFLIGGELLNIQRHRCYLKK